MVQVGVVVELELFRPMKKGDRTLLCLAIVKCRFEG
jgi:hypothetical protein